MRALLLLIAGALLASPAWPQAPPAFPQGATSGDVTDSRAVIWTRVSAPAAVRVELGTSPVLGGPTSAAVRAEPEADLTVKVDLSGLRPATRYHYRVIAEAGDRRTAGLLGSFQTAPVPSDAADVTFIWGADISERFMPFRIFEAMRSKEPDFFLLLGDTIYSDVDRNARTLEEYRDAYRRNRDDEAFQRFLRATSTYAVWDDHEVANNFDRTHARMPIGRQAFFEYWPIRRDAADPNRLYRSIRWGRYVEVFILDARQYRDPAHDPITPQKTLLGTAQKEWLKRGLVASTATFKVIATSVPLKYHGVDSWEGYTTERQELFDFITRNTIRGVVFLAGDVHYAAVLRYPQGFVEAIAGPLAQFISRRRAAAGEPETEFAFNRSFTFGLVRVSASSLVIELYDVEGKLLHRSTVQR